MFATGPVAIVLPSMGIGGRLWNNIMDINKPRGQQALIPISVSNKKNTKSG